MKSSASGCNGLVDFAYDRFQVTGKDPVQFTPRGPLPGKNGTTGRGTTGTSLNK